MSYKNEAPRAYARGIFGGIRRSNSKVYPSTSLRVSAPHSSAGLHPRFSAKADKGILIVIPARSGSKRIPRKNLKPFLGKPLIAYTIKQALGVGLADRVIVDTDSPKTAAIARSYGAEVPFLRPPHLAGDRAQVADALVYLVGRLKKEENYAPAYVMILQTTSPLREQKDINACWDLMRRTDATTVLTVAPTHPRLYYLDKKQNLILANRIAKNSTNIQEWPPAYILNGCFVYIVKTSALLKEKSVITRNTKAVICERWRSVDLDTPEEWVWAEFLYKNRNRISRRIKSFHAG